MRSIFHIPENLFKQQPHEKSHEKINATNGIREFLICRHFQVNFHIQINQKSFKQFITQVLTASKTIDKICVISLIYLRRLRLVNPNVIAQNGSEYRLFLTAVILANKFFDDEAPLNSCFSRVSGIPLRQVNIMEVEFLRILDFNLVVSKKEYDLFLVELSKALLE